MERLCCHAAAAAARGTADGLKAGPGPQPMNGMWGIVAPPNHSPRSRRMSQVESSSPADHSTELPPHLRQIGAGIDFADPNSPLAPYYLRTSDVLAVGLLAALFFFL